MKALSTLMFAVGVAVAVPALAADAPQLKKNMVVRTAEGTRVGRIERINTDASGAPTSVSIIYNGRFISVPADSLTAGEGGIVTNKTRKELNKL